MIRHLGKDPIIHTLADANPVPVTPLDPAQQTRADALLQRTVTAPRTPAPTRHRVTRGWAAALGTLAAALAAALAAVLAGLFAIAPATASPAQRVLLEAAGNVGPEPVRTGEYWYVRSEIQYIDDSAFSREDWVSPHRTLIRDTSEAVRRAQETGTTSLDPDLIRVDLTSDDQTPGMLPPRFAYYGWGEMMALPTDPVALRERLVRDSAGSGHSDAWNLWDVTTGLLFFSPAPLELRRALWEVAATIPGIELLGPTTDSLGRPATGVQIDFGAERLGHYAILLDPSDGTVLQIENRDSAADDVSYRYTLLESGWRDDAPDPDPPICGPGSEPYRSC